MTVTATDRQDVASNTATITTAVSSFIFWFYWFCTVPYSTVKIIQTVNLLRESYTGDYTVDQSSETTLTSYLPTLPVFPGVSKFFIISPGLPVRAPNLPERTYHGLFQIFFINFVVFEMSKRKIKQMDLVLLFELFLIRKRKTDQPNCYIFNKYCNWSEINQSNCTIHGRSWHCFCMPLSTSGTFGRHAGDFRRVFETLLKFTFLQCKHF